MTERPNPDPLHVDAYDLWTDEERDAADHEVGWCGCAVQGKPHQYHPNDGYSYAGCAGPLCTMYREHADPTRAERRASRVANGRKMGVVGRSTLLLGALAAGQQRRRVQRRKRGDR